MELLEVLYPATGVQYKFNASVYYLDLHVLLKCECQMALFFTFHGTRIPKDNIPSPVMEYCIYHDIVY